MVDVDPEWEMAVVAGASAPFLRDLSRIDGWIPVLSVLSATLATQLFLGRNEFQAGLYQSASVQLEFMKKSWLLAGEEGALHQARQVAWFEEALAKIKRVLLLLEPAAPAEEEEEEPIWGRGEGGAHRAWRDAGLRAQAPGRHPGRVAAAHAARSGIRGGGRGEGAEPRRRAAR